MKHKHSKARKFLLTFLIVFAVGTSGITGYALITGNMPPILNTIFSGLFSSGSGSKTMEKADLQLNTESSPLINPQKILSTPSTTVSNSTSSVDPDVKIDENQLSPQGLNTPMQPISVTTSQKPTSTSSHLAATSSSSKPVTSSSSSHSPVSSAPESSVSSAPVVSVPSSSSGHHSPPQISGVILDKTELTMNKGDISPVLITTIAPSNASGDKSITWTSANESIATVDPLGHVTAVSRGTTKIVANTSNGKTSACAVTVLVPASSIKINSEAFSIDKGASKTLTATVGPEDATDKTVIWATSNNDVVSVDIVGKITAEKPGTATITATTGDGKFSTTCDVTVGISISSLTLNKKSTTLIKGTEENLTATIDPPDTTENSTIKWTSSNTSVATIDSNGKITALARGAATITAEAGTHCAECVVTVIVPANGINLNKPSITLAKGTEEILKATIFPEDSTDNAIKWTSSDESIATVDVNGTVTAVSVGTTVITVTTHDGNFKSECIVTVVIPVTGITIDKTELTLIKGISESLTAAITPIDTTDQAVTWSSSNTNIATVDENGKITAINGGTATIKVTTHDGNFTAECKLTVIVPVSGISLNKATLPLIKGTAELLTATISPEDATNKNISWATSNSNVCSVDENGKVTAIIPGAAVITVTSEDGGKVAQCTVNVVIPVTGITINKLSISLMKGTDETLTTSITPTDATNQNVIWTSTNTSIATVDQNGKISAMGVGTAAIKATTTDGHFTVQCAVTVTPDTYTVSANAVNGYVTGVGTHHVGSIVTLTAVPNAHYHFTGWSDGVSTASRIITVTQDVNVSVNFAIDTFAVYANTSTGGTASGTNWYNYGSYAALTATPNDNYRFTNWTCSNGNTNTNPSFSYLVDSNVTWTANFVQIFTVASAPTNLACTGINGTYARLSFTPPTYTGNCNITRYNIYLDGSPIIARDPQNYSNGAAPTQTDVFVPYGSMGNHTLSVTAVNNMGESISVSKKYSFTKGSHSTSYYNSQKTWHTDGVDKNGKETRGHWSGGWDTHEVTDYNVTEIN